MRSTDGSLLMTNNILNDADQIKAILVKTKGTPTQKLLAILLAAGVETTAELATLLDLKPRAIQTAKRNTLRATHCVSATECAQHIAPAQPIAHQSAIGCASAKERFPTPLKENTTTTNTCLPDRANEPAGWVELKAKFNGSTEAMVRDAQRWMGPLADRQCAIDWLTGTAEAYGANKTLRAWTCLLTDEASGKPIKRGTAAWANTARGLRDDTPPVENIFAAQTKGVARNVRPAPGSERMAGV